MISPGAAYATLPSPPRPTSRAEIVSALARQQDLRQRIKAVQSLSQSTAVASAFAQSVPGKRPPRQKAEFHFRASNSSRCGGGGGIDAPGPGPVELADLTRGLGVRQELRMNAADRRGNDVSYWMARGTAEQQREEEEKRKSAVSPTASHILGCSRAVEAFTASLNESRKRLQEKTQVPSSSIVDDDARKVTMTHKQRKAAHFLRGVVHQSKKKRAASASPSRPAESAAGARGRGEGAAALVRSSSSSSLSVRPSSSLGLPMMPAAAGRAEQEQEARCPSPTRTAPREFVPLLEREQVAVNETVKEQSYQQQHAKEELLLSKRLLVRPNSVPPTAMTNKTLLSTTSYRQLVASSKKMNQQFDLNARIAAKTTEAASASAAAANEALRAQLLQVAQRRNALLKNTPSNSGGTSGGGGGRPQAAPTTKSGNFAAR